MHDDNNQNTLQSSTNILTWTLSDNESNPAQLHIDMPGDVFTLDILCHCRRQISVFVTFASGSAAWVVLALPPGDIEHELGGTVSGSGKTVLEERSSVFALIKLARAPAKEDSD